MQRSGIIAGVLSFFVIIGSVAPVAAQECVSRSSGLVAWWPGDGTTDDIAGGRHGTLNGATFAVAKVDQGFYFQPLTEVSVTDDPVWTLGDSAFTIDAWVNFETVGIRNAFVGHDEGGGELNKWIFWYDAGGHRQPSGPALRFHINGPDLPALDPIVYPWNPNPGTWYHVAVTREGVNYALYIDGVQVITETDANSIPDPNAALTIGNAEGLSFNGRIDEVEIFDRALDPLEIAAVFNAGSAGKCKSLQVTIDIKPGSDPNCFNINGHGVIPVAINGSADFHVYDIDVDTLKFDGLAVRVRGNKGPLCSIEYSNSDGYLDMVCHFEDDAENWSGGGSTATLTGNLLDGTAIEGTDSICIVP